MDFPWNKPTSYWGCPFMGILISPFFFSSHHWGKLGKATRLWLISGGLASCFKICSQGGTEGCRAKNWDFPQMGIPNSWLLYNGKSYLNGWELGVPLWLRKPPFGGNNTMKNRWYFGAISLMTLILSLHHPELVIRVSVPRSWIGWSWILYIPWILHGTPSCGFVQ